MTKPIRVRRSADREIDALADYIAQDSLENVKAGKLFNLD
jgi:hypothetical protein